MLNIDVSVDGFGLALAKKSGVRYDPFFRLSLPEGGGQKMGLIKISHETLQMHGFDGVKWKKDVVLTAYWYDIESDIHTFRFASPDMPTTSPGGMAITVDFHQVADVGKDSPYTEMSHHAEYSGTFETSGSGYTAPVTKGNMVVGTPSPGNSAFDFNLTGGLISFGGTTSKFPPLKESPLPIGEAPY